MEKGNLLGVFVLGLFLFSGLGLVSAASYNEAFLTNDTHTISQTPTVIDQLYSYNDTWLSFDGLSSLFLSSAMRDLVQFEWNGSGSWSTQKGIDASPNSYPVYHNGSGYIFGAYNSSANYSGGLDEINLYDYEVNSSVPGSYYATFDGVNDYLRNVSTVGLALSNNVTIAGWFQPTGVLPSAVKALVRHGGGDYQLFAYDSSSRSWFGNGAGWNTTRPGLLATNPQRWQFLAATYDDVNGIDFFSNRYPERIYSIGDSITAGHGGTAHCTQYDNCAFSAGTRLSHTYQYWLDYYMGSFSSAESATTTFYNKGWGSQTCDDLIARWNNVSSGLKNDTKVMIMCGINDEIGNYAEVEDDYDQIVALAQARNQTLYWGEVLPTTSACSSSSSITGMINVNNYLDSLGDTYDFINVIHWHNNFTNGTYGCANASLFEDGIHPTEAGYKVLGYDMWQEGFGGVDYTQTLQLQEQDAANGAFSGITPSGNENISIGASEAPNYFYNGSMQNIMVFNNSISFADLNTTFNNGRQVSTPNQYLVSNWILNNTLMDIVSTNDLSVGGETIFTSDDGVQGVLAFFNFDGDLDDSSAPGYSSATLQGTGGSTSAQGIYNQGLTLSGNAGNIVNASGMGSSLDLAGKNFTISVWAKTDDTNTLAGILGNRFDIGGWLLSFYQHKIQLYVGSTGSTVSSSADLTTNNQWYHLVVTFNVNTGNYSFYIDGNPSGSTVSALRASATGGNNFVIGGDPRDGSGIEFGGQLDDLLIENKYRNATEVLDLYDNGLFSLKEHLKLNENNGTNAYNIQNTTNNGTISDATWENDGVEINLTEDTNFSVNGALLTLIGDTYDWNWLNLNYQVDEEAPSVNLTFPKDGYSETSSSATINFQFNTSDELENVTYCSVFLDDTEYTNTSAISESETNNISISSIAVGSHSWYVYCNDTLGNGANSTSISFTIIAPSTNTDEASSGIGGAPTYYPSDEKLARGYEIALATDFQTKFNLGGNLHTLKVNDLTNNSVNITISSEPLTFVLNTGETQKADIDGDGVYDLSVFLKSISGGRANFVLTSISEAYGQINTETGQVNGPNSLSDLPGKSENSPQNNHKGNIYFYLIIAVGIIAVLAFVALFIFLRIFKKWQSPQSVTHISAVSRKLLHIGK